jgi:hypothetical protein
MVLEAGSGLSSKNLLEKHAGTAAMCGALGAAQPDESVADPIDLRCRLRRLQGSQCADASMP